MFKYVIFAAALLSASVSAQDTQPNVGKPSTAENAKIGQPDEQFCTYEDKKFTDGAVKKIDGIALVCMKDHGVTVVSYSGAARPAKPLVWEPVNSPRGRDRLNLKSSSDVFK